MTVNWNEVTNATVHNVLKKFRVTVTKTDRETGTPQGDATLAGAVYGIYDGDTLIDTYTTDSAALPRNIMCVETTGQSGRLLRPKGIFWMRLPTMWERRQPFIR